MGKHSKSTAMIRYIRYVRMYVALPTYSSDDVLMSVMIVNKHYYEREESRIRIFFDPFELYDYFITNNIYI